MAKISIKGRQDPIYLSNTRARIIDNMRSNEETPKTHWFQIIGDREEVLWSGEIGRVGDIEYDKERQQVNSTASFEEEDKKYREARSRMSPEQKAMELSRFRYYYWRNCSGKKSEEEGDTDARAIQIQFTYFRQNPKAVWCPVELYQPLFQGGEQMLPLHENMKIENNIDQK